MPAPGGLLGAKLEVQARGLRRVARQRLLARIATAPEARLVLVSAPAGFGKTTLLADWLAAADVRSAWLSLDRGDNDIVRFARYLAGTAARFGSGIADDLVFDPARPFDPDVALSIVLERLAAAGGRTPAGEHIGAGQDTRADDGGRQGGDGERHGGDVPIAEAVIVLDDYHLIDDLAIHRLVTTLIERLPRGTRLAIATRADPPLPLARLRARGELLEVRAEDLRFTAAEADELLRSAGVELAAGDVEELTDRTEGWAAVLRLAAVSLRGRPDQDELVRRFGASHRFILDYVVEEVLAGLPPETQDFLLRTSILERLSAPLCEAVAGEPDGQARLEELERANLLIVPLDDERRWYRYHALFAEILRARLGTLHPDELGELHARASAWHEEEGNDDDAIHHALRSGDRTRMARVVSYAVGRHINAGELITVRHWLDALPADVVRDHAQLSAAYAWYFVLVGEPGRAAERLAEAEEALADGRDGGPMMRPGIPAQLAMLRSQLAGLEADSDTAIAEARRAFELVPATLPPEPAAILRGTAGALLALALLRAGDLDAAARAYEVALPDLRVGGSAFAVGRAIADLAGIAIARGDPTHAVHLCESELARGDDACRAAGGGAVWAALARARSELGEIELAEAAARRALELASRAGDRAVVQSAQATLDRVGPSRAQVAVGPGLGLASTRAAEVESLTSREIDVLRLVALGRSNSQVAAELFVTVGTVKSHLHTIAGKLGAANRVESVARGRELGLLA